MIKHAHPTMLRMILSLYNTIFTSNTFPAQWRLSVVVSFPKPNKKPRLKDNHRPISLSSCLCKVMEKMVNFRLMYVSEKLDVLTLTQCGFRGGRSTTDNLVCLESALCSAIAAKHHTILILFDLKKAYDTAWKHNIIRTLHQYGIRGHLHFLSNFFSDRRLKVRIRSTVIRIPSS